MDDASILEPGQCLLETWADRFSRDAGTVLHAGGACRVRSVELGLNLDHARISDETVVLAGTQIKWAQPLSDTLAAGLVVAAFVAERFRELATNYWRAGARFAPMPAVTVDLSHARGINEAVPSRWAVGVT